MVASLPQATGFSLKDKTAFGLAATDATGFVAVVAMGDISIVIASGPTGAALMGVDALFLVAGRVSTTDLQVTLLGAYTFTICLIGTPKPACTTASVNVFLPEVKMVAANSGTFSGCLALSVEASYPTIPLSSLSLSWSVKKADGLVIATPAGWAVGSAIHPLIPTALGRSPPAHSTPRPAHRSHLTPPLCL